MALRGLPQAAERTAVAPGSGIEDAELSACERAARCDQERLSSAHMPHSSKHLFEHQNAPRRAHSRSAHELRRLGVVLQHQLDLGHISGWPCRCWGHRRSLCAETSKFAILSDTGCMDLRRQGVAGCAVSRPRMAPCFGYELGTFETLLLVPCAGLLAQT